MRETVRHLSDRWEAEGTDTSRTRKTRAIRRAGRSRTRNGLAEEVEDSLPELFRRKSERGGGKTPREHHSRPLRRRVNSFFRGRFTPPRSDLRRKSSGSESSTSSASPFLVLDRPARRIARVFLVLGSVCSFGFPGGRSNAARFRACARPVRDDLEPLQCLWRQVQFPRRTSSNRSSAFRGFPSTIVQSWRRTSPKSRSSSLSSPNEKLPLCAPSSGTDFTEPLSRRPPW